MSETAVETPVSNGAPIPSCNCSPENKMIYWCEECRVGICENCVEGKHEDHNLKLMKFILKKLINEASSRLEVIKTEQSKNLLQQSISTVTKELLFYQNKVNFLMECQRQFETERT